MTSHELKSKLTAEPPQNGWRFDKSISLGTILAILCSVFGVGGPMLLWARATENRIQIIETQDEARAKAFETRDKEAAEQRKEFLTRMDKFSEQVTLLRIAIGVQPARK